MKKYLVRFLLGAFLGMGVNAAPVYAFGWPTFDLAEVANTIFSGISQLESQVSTAMETYSIANIQQAIGDKLGGLQKIKDAKAKIEKAKEKAELIKKRAEKIKELKEKYEKKVKDTIGEVKDAYSAAQGYVQEAKNQVENVKSQVEGAKSQVEGAINNAKNQIDNVKNQVEGAVNDAKNKVENVKNQVENTVNTAGDKVNDLFGSDEDNFDFETNAPAIGSGSGYTQGGFEGAAFGNFSEATLGDSNGLKNAEDIEWGGEDTSELQINSEPVSDKQNAEISVHQEDDEMIEMRAEKKINKETEEDEDFEQTGRTQVKAFKKVSFEKMMKAGFAAASFKTGTDDDGNFYFPDAFAQWVGINFDDKVEDETLWAGINTICAQLHSPDNHKTEDFSRTYDYEIIGQMRANAQAHSTVGANEAESGKTLEDVAKTINVAGNQTNIQLSGIGEIGVEEIHQKRMEIVRLSDEIMAIFFDRVKSYCIEWPYDEEDIK